MWPIFQNRVCALLLRSEVKEVLVPGTSEAYRALLENPDSLPLPIQAEPALWGATCTASQGPTFGLKLCSNCLEFLISVQQGLCILVLHSAPQMHS